jgi:predicted nucleotidyltransferase
MIKNESTFLLAYQHERVTFLQKVHSQLQQDSRISAAWLIGSLGRGGGDELSDLDLWLMVRQDSIAQLVNERRSFAAQFGDLVLYLEAPPNGPAGGGFLDVCYDAPTAPHLVDWIWQPDSLASPPGQTKLLFDRASLTRREKAVQFSTQTTPDELLSTPMHYISFFWMMLMVTAKYVARHSARVDELLNITLPPFRQALGLITSAGSAAHISAPDRSIPGESGSDLQFLRQLADKMQAMMAEITEMGYPTPEKIVPGAFRFLDMVEDLMKN